MEQKTEFIKHTFGSQIHRLMPTLIGDPDHTCALLQIFAKAKKTPEARNWHVLCNSLFQRAETHS